MKNRLLFLLIFWGLVLTSCGTPPEVKQLSLKQMEYFDYAIEGMNKQSEALVFAVEKLVRDAKEKIDSTEAINKARFEKLVMGDLSQDVAKEVLSEVSETTKKAIDARAKLDSDLSAIKEKTELLKAYLVKMKEVHQALDAYIQSEKAGERVVNDILNYPSINALFETANKLIPKVQNSIDDVNNLLNGM